MTTRDRRTQLMTAALAGVLAVGVLTLAAGCLSPDSGQRRAKATYDDYVALGDSYTAAPFVPRRIPARGCERSTGNYPHLVAERIGATLEDRSCGAAKVEHMTSRQRPDVPPQLDAISEDTDLVTVSIGAANRDLFPTLVGGCVGLALKEPEGTPCKDAVQEDGEDELLAGIEKTEDEIVELLEEIQDRGPNARVLFVGYPSIFPESGSCPDRLPLTPGDTTYAAEVMAAMVEAQRAAAKRADVEFVDVYAVTRGHDICADDPWIQGRLNDPDKALYYHPFAAEQDAAADVVTRRLR